MKMNRLLLSAQHTEDQCRTISVTHFIEGSGKYRINLKCFRKINPSPKEMLEVGKGVTDVNLT